MLKRAPEPACGKTLVASSPEVTGSVVVSIDVWQEPRPEALILALAGASRLASLRAQLKLFERNLEICVGSDELSAREGIFARAVLVDELLLEELEPGWSDHFDGASIVVLSEDGGFEVRQRAVALGCHSFVTLPVDAAALLDRIGRLRVRPTGDAYRVFALDDDDAICHLYTMYLRDPRFHLRTFTTPEEMFEALHDEVPELFVLDYHLGHCTGVEVAVALRQDHDFIGVPIVFVSANTQADVHFGAVVSGGDQFVQKPIEQAHFIQMIEATILRFRRLRSLMSHDSLTQLHNHTSFKQQLALQTVLAFRQNHPLSLVMMDIDHFKDVNDTYGHPVGDRVLRVLAQLLRGRLRRSDIIGRYGGDEFAVLMPDTDVEGALVAMQEVSRHFASLEHRTDDDDGGDTSFRVSLSCGIAGYPNYSNESELTLAADRALYQAKHEGRARICLAPDPQADLEI